MGAATLESEVVRDRSNDLPAGTLVGDYEVEATIGSGGMATVYQAVQPVIGKRVAIKVMHQTKSDTSVGRFVKEARAINLIGHPNIVDVFNFGMTAKGRPYLVMELLVGETLAVRIKRGDIDVAETCTVLIEVTHALEAAHDVGIIHRDLKPENIFLARRKDVTHVKLLDFGIAKLFGEGDTELGGEVTRPGVLIGTPRYISPEQVRGAALDGRVDIYALGVVAFELLTGRAPFNAASSFDLFQKHAKLRPPVPTALNPALPKAVDALIGAMLAKDPGERPTLSAVREQLTVIRSAPARASLAPRSSATDLHAVAPSTAPTTATVLPRSGTMPTPTPAPTISTLSVSSSVTDHNVTEVATAPVRLRRTRLERWGPRAVLVTGIAVGGVLLALVLTHHEDREGSPKGNQPAALWSPPPPAPIIVPATTAAIDPPAPPVTPAAPPTDDAEDPIELDPITHVASPVKRSRTLHTRRPPPKTEREASPKDNLKTAPPEREASPKGDDDAVRSPFEHAP